MLINPVQIILNDQDFHQAPEPGQPPRTKDFYDGADAAFAAHQGRVARGGRRGDRGREEEPSRTGHLP
ncbi:hypothetical protein ACRAWD_26735 [Caulobacter segnis]